MNFVKGKRCLTSVDFDLSLFRLELPWYLIFSVGHEANEKFAKHIDLVICPPVVSMAGIQIKPKMLADYVVKRHGKEVSS